MLKLSFIHDLGLTVKPHEPYSVLSNVAITGFDVSIDVIKGISLYHPNSCGTEHPNKCIESFLDIIP
jgi:hypothetical protein